MNFKIFAPALLGLLVSSMASADTTYLLTITNGSPMPLSPGVLYASSEGYGTAPVGQAPTAGFVQLCQTGNTMTKLSELQADKNILATVLTEGPILPGEARTFEIAVPKKTESLSFETMYGKTKDVCGVVTISRHSLVALEHHVTKAVNGSDQVLLSGAFKDPVADHYAEQKCMKAKTGVECLRALSAETTGTVRVFPGYLPSVINFLETKYGAADAASLLLPTSGAIQYQLVLKH